MQASIYLKTNVEEIRILCYCKSGLKWINTCLEKHFQLLEEMCNSGTRKDFKYSFILVHYLPPDKTRANQFHTELKVTLVFNHNEWEIKRFFNKKKSLLMQFRSTASHTIGGSQTISVHHAASILHRWSNPHTSKVLCAAISMDPCIIFYFKSF